jgi:FAD/FMN-containing dehydrogenase
MGPLLGGGHGFLQGRYGLVVDNVVSARVVLANSTVVTVSGEENGELFWALRGAGHNFGIVTEVRSRVYDVPDRNM